MTKSSINLSASKLGLLKECARCFYLESHKIVERPRGIFSSLPNAIDLILKNWIDSFRGSIPPILETKIIGSILYDDIAALKRWRNWRSGLKFEIEPGFEFIGAIDDVLIDSTKKIIPLDFKTTGKEPDSGYGAKYYKTQLECYALMFQKNGYEINEAGKGKLIFLYPKSFSTRVQSATSEGVVSRLLELGIECTVQDIDLNLDAAEENIKRAVSILKSTKVPDSNPECQFCNYGNSITNINFNQAIEDDGK